MVVVVPGPAPLDTAVVDCWTTDDENLGLFVVFIGQSTTTNVTQSSSRIQSHVFSIGGLQSFPRLTINPSSALYSAVNYLPDDDQGDETRRGLAISLLKYFTEMPKLVRQLLSDKIKASQPHGKPLALFDAAHAASLASRVRKVDNAAEIAAQITAGMAERTLSWLDLDVVLPADSITLIRPPPPEGRASLVPLPDTRPVPDYGPYNDLVDLLGETAFLPTSRMRRAPSKPTAVSRTRVLDKDKEDGLRREMLELIATERSYVAKLNDLEQSIAANYVRGLADASDHNLSAADQAMKTLFPPSLLQILALNEHFLQAIEKIVHATANPGSGTHARSARDPTGALAFSKAMLEYFPHFRESYQDYLRNSSHFSKTLTDVLKDRSSPCANAIVASGEQRLKSWLIEPVQRLPRYSLFIDNMANLLPAEHPAMSRFLRARDIITEICALEGDGPANDLRVAQRLRDLVQSWPQRIGPCRRLITAADAIQLSSPYLPDPYGKNGDPVVILLFSDQLVFLEKTGSMSSRGLLAEIDRPLTSPSDQPTEQSFAFLRSMSLDRCRFLESHHGKLVHVDGPAAKLIDSHDGSQISWDDRNDVYQLLGGYDEKASKFTEDVALALIEGRFPEKMREDERWTLKSVSSTGSDGLGLVVAIYQSDELMSPTSFDMRLGRTRIVVDGSTSKIRNRDGQPIDHATEVVVNVTVLAGERFTVEVLSYGRRASSDTVAKEELVNLLVKRLSYVLRVHNRPFNEETAYASISLAREVVVCLQPRTEAIDVPAETSQELPSKSDSRRFRPFSPVKGLSSILGGGPNQPVSLTKQLSGRRRGYTTETASTPPLSHSQSSTLQEPDVAQDTDRFQVKSAPSAQGQSSEERLETTFNTYITALRTRKGNIVGRVIHNRASADELSVNELYNALIQNPADHQAAAEVSVDVLFAAFEKFIDAAWKKHAGPIILPSVLADMQSLLFSDVPGMVQQFKTIMSELSRLNQRAFRSLIGVLTELVGATSNDGDRGSLIMTFAEVLVVDGNPVEYIMLFDRLLAEADILFGLQPPGPAGDAPDRTRAANTGSIGSTASSIGKKFGFFGGLSRGNSKAGGESESKVSQVLRQLSKRSNADTESTPSISRSFLSRGRSADSRPTTPSSSVSRPGSSYSGQNVDPSSRPGSAHSLIKPLAPINEDKMKPPMIPPRRKRRSSLSDLTGLGQNEVSSFDTGAETAKGTRPLPALQKSASLLTSQGRPNFLGEVQPLNLQHRGLGRTGSTTNDGSPSRNTKSPTPSSSSTARQGAATLAASKTPNLSPTKFKAPTSPQRLRVQSPQRLRERLENEKQAMGEVGPELQAELASIGRELGAMRSSASQTAPRTALDDLTAKVATLESLLRTRLDGLGQQTDEIRADYESSLAVSEKKAKHLDELYREANVENELLYDRFNGELSKVLKAVRGTSEQNGGIVEMRRVLQEAQDEAARLRKDNQRLKRENLGLRSQLRNT